MFERLDLRRSIALTLALSIVIAPFLALAFRLEAGLGVMALGLVAVAFLVREALEIAPASAQRWLRGLFAANLVLAGACLVALMMLLIGS
jgi:hypothetical protein